MARVLILGGTNFLGPHVVHGLARRGHALCIFHRGDSEPDLPSSVRHVHGSFELFSSHLEELLAFAPDVVLDTVPYRDKNGLGISHFAGVAQRGVVVTSADVYRAFARIWGSEPGPPDAVPLTEESPLREKPAPDLTEEIDYDNLDVERMVMRSNLPATVLRAPIIFGPGDPLHRLHRYLQRMDDKRPAILMDSRLAEMRFSRSYVENVAHALVLAASTPTAAGKTYNVGPEHTLTEREWVAAIAQAHGWRGALVAAPEELLPEQLRIPFNAEQHLVLDSSLIREALSYTEDVPLHDALVRTIEWERANPPAVASASFDYDAEDLVLARM
jgi:nucleoside-diphosphate-sugar epimerase